MKVKKNESNESLLDIDDTARVLNMSSSRIRYEVFLGRIPFLKIGRSIRFRRSDLEAWLKTKVQAV